MDDLIKFSLAVFTGFFAIMNPVAGVPVFLSLVQDADSLTKRNISKKATTVAFLITLTFILLGKFIFELFRITIPAFKITGGILIFFVGFEMLQSKKSTIKHLNKVEVDETLAISPLAIPLLSGPGTIVTAMNFVTNADFIHIAIVVLVFALMCWLTHIAFNLGEFIIEKVGNNIIVVIGKIMGLIIAIIGTNMVIEGIKIAFSLPT